MFRIPRTHYRRSYVHNMRRDYHRPPQNPQWRNPGGPRVPFPGQHQLPLQHRPPIQFGNDNYWCETCDRGFPTEEILSKHNQQHQKCNIDGCQFVAHPKVITKHIQMQHSTGLYKKIANIKNPEEIEKWREERRRKYPTKTNIEKKAAELTEKIDRGEKMGLDGNRNCRNVHNSAQNRKNNSGQGFKRRNNMQNENQPRTKFIRNNTTDNNHKKPLKGRPQILPIIEENRKLQPFTGILNLLMDSDDEIEDSCIETSIVIEDDNYCEEPKSNEKKAVDTTEPVVCGALSSLICDYASSDEEDTKEMVLKITTKNINQELSEIVQINKISKTDFVLKCNENIEAAIFNNSSLEGFKCKTEIRKECIDSEAIVKVRNDVGDSNEITLNKIKQVSTNLDFIVQTHSVDGDDNDSGPEEVKAVVRKQKTASTSAESSKPKDAIRKKMTKDKNLTFQQTKLNFPSTLLHKLLFKEMQQERNIVLQCIRYIRKNNYFDKK